LSAASQATAVRSRVEIQVVLVATPDGCNARATLNATRQATKVISEVRRGE